MTTSDKIFAGNVPALYQKFMVPMIFEPYARDTAERVRQGNPKDVLEIATGTGVVTRAMAAVLGPDVRITATDLNQPMLDVAAEKQGADSRITWRQADGQALPFEDQSFDTVVCQFGMMFFPDKIKGYREARRVLRPGGRYIIAVWDRVDTNEFISNVDTTLKARFPADPPLFMERTPHGYWNLEVIESELKAAGFVSVHAETINHRSRAASALDATTGYCAGSPLAGEIEARAPGQLASIIQDVAEALAKQFGRGPIEGRVCAHILTSTK
jgi:ubiquinone/menaquinone biosynthesis C-methylase UbiE